jgi:nitroreductase
VEAIEAILTRRSMRRYTEAPVSDEQVRRLLEAAMAAPSGHNKQPWHFIVVRDRATLLEVPKFHPYSKMLGQCALAIVVCGDLDLDGGTKFWVQDCSAATQNILIAAHAMGLGAVWLGVYPHDDLVAGVRALLGIPERIVPLNIVSVGYPAEPKPPGNRYNEERVHGEKW